MTSLDRFVLMFFMAMALALNGVIGKRNVDVIPIFGKHHVYVGNDLGEGVTLTLHCASRDDDLGTHVLPYGANYTWGFRSHLWKRTLFWCDFKWGSVNAQNCTVYDGKTEQSFHSNAHWLSRMDGLYFYIHSDEKYKLFMSWGK
ncbi:hypothetical protein HHK36_020379 [Tetracentron sinense]|uniref:S-protein homolog n=1 Tax=Tetracentron sinense TaxID=13715 RepID=A0A835D7Z0_TETSI|nr:hypothetical protein HHK36_020379 [Tetracentron sinense]